MENEECKSALDLMQPEVLSVEVLRRVLSQVGNNSGYWYI